MFNLGPKFTAWKARRAERREYLRQLAIFDAQIAFARSKHRRVDHIVAAKKAYVHACLERPARLKQELGRA